MPVENQKGAWLRVGVSRELRWLAGVLGVLACGVFPLTTRAQVPAPPASNQGSSESEQPNSPAAEEPATSADTGAVAGVVRYVADPQRPWRYSRYYIQWPKRGELAEAVVALRGAGLANVQRPKRTEPVAIDQKDYRFIPETVSLRVGEKVRFTNSDVTVHNVMTFDGARPFNVNTPMGGSYEHTFVAAGGTRQPIRIGCTYHSQMRSWIFVFSHPFHTVTGANGKFLLPRVPPGEYELEMVHAAGNLRTNQKITVVAGQTAEVELKVSPDNLVESKP